MALMSNVKAQANHLYSKVSKSKIGATVRSNLTEEGLIGRTQQSLLRSISEANSKEAVGKVNALNGMVGKEAGKVAQDNMSSLATRGLDGLNHEKTKKYLDKRGSKSDILKAYQEMAIMDTAANNVVEQVNKAGVGKLDTIITQSARSVDGQVSFMTPLLAAKEYYGKPLSGAIQGIRNKDKQSIIDNGTKLGIRAGATAGAIGAGATVASGTVGLTQKGINSVRGNSYERE